MCCRTLVLATALLLSSRPGGAAPGDDPSADRPRLVIQVGHAVSPSQAALSPDGRRVLSSAGTEAVILWDAETGRELRRFELRCGRGGSAAFTLDGRFFILNDVMGDGAAIFDAVTGAEDGRFSVSGEEILSMEASSDGRHLLTGSNGGKARLYDLASGDLRWEYEARGSEPRPGENPAAVRGVAFAPRGGEVALAARGNLWSAVVFLDRESGRERRRLAGPMGVMLRAVSYSPDGSLVLTRDIDDVVVWDAAAGNRLWSRPAGTSLRLVLSGDGRYALPIRQNPYDTAVDPEAVLRDARTGEAIRTIAPASGEPVSGTVPCVRGGVFSPDGESLYTVGDFEPLRRWSTKTGEELDRFGGEQATWTSLDISADGRVLLLGGVGGVVLFEPALQRLVNCQRLVPIVTGVSASSDGRRMLITTAGLVAGACFSWDAAEGAPRVVPGSVQSLVALDGRRIILEHVDGVYLVLDAADLRELRRIPARVPGGATLAVTPDGKRFIAGDNAGATLYDAETGEVLWTIEGPACPVAISGDGRKILAGNPAQDARVLSAETGEVLYVLSAEDVIADTSHLKGGRRVAAAHRVRDAAFTADGARIVTLSDAAMRTWNVADGSCASVVSLLPPRHRIAVSPDGATVAVGDASGGIELRRTSDGGAVGWLGGHHGAILGLGFIDGGRRLLSGSLDGTAILFDVVEGRPILTLAQFADGSFAVVDPDGRFDASNAGDVEGLHWVIGDEAVALGQLEDRYYDPGLLAKHLGFATEPLREVAGFSAPRLYPRVAVTPPDEGDSHLRIELADRGGGIGRVVVLVNDKEVTADARGGAVPTDAKEATLSIDLAGDPRLRPGEENVVTVLAFNAEGYLVSRGLSVTWSPPGEAPPPPSIWAVVCGVSDYRGDAIDLRYADKDAADFAAALTLAAGGLLGADRVHLSLLSTSGADGTVRPTRENLTRAFEAARAAQPDDLLVVYLCGHGVNYGGQEGDFHYLLADAAGTDLSDPEVRKQASVSSAELTEWIKAIPATKRQVLILDTCASGTVVEKLSERREVPGSQVRAVGRLKDRTGVFVLAGCAADQVSYEASRYGQGLLTYSLLFGMRGPGLRDEGFVDVAKLFSFAADTVPELARDIGGIQRPVLAMPKGGGSFDIGMLDTAARAKVPLAAVKPVFSRCGFQEERRPRDGLGLGRAVETALRDAGARPAAPLVFVDARDVPGAYELTGRYEAREGRVAVSAVIYRGVEELSAFAVTGFDADLPSLAAKVVEEALARLPK